MPRRRTGARTYVRFDDNYDENPKIAALSDAAFRAHVSAVCYCGRNLTDGQLPLQIARKLGPPRALRELVDSGLFVVTETGYEVHDYLEHQRSADQVKDLVAKRQEAGSRGGTAKANNVATGVANATPVAEQTGSNGLPEDRGQRTEVTTTTSSPRAPRRGTARDEPETFAEFWAAYPTKRGGRKKALELYRVALKTTTHETIMAGLRATKFSPDESKQPHAQTWLHQERWTVVEPVQAPTSGSGGRPRMYDVSRLPAHGQLWTDDQVDLVLGPDTTPLEPPADLDASEVPRWRDREGRKRRAKRRVEAQQITGWRYEA